MNYRVFCRLACQLILSFILMIGLVIPAVAAKSKTVFVLFDVSDSTKNQAARELYLKDFKAILEGVNAGDAIAADRIAESSAAGSTLPIKKEFDGMLNSNRLKEKKAKTEILAEAKKLLEKPEKVRYTDILGSLQIAERIFDTYKKDRNVLVIMSDMIEDSKSYNFEKEKLTDKRISEIISREKAANRLPDLKGVKVYAVKNATSQSTDRHIAIEKFWLSYLKECGAQISKAQYGPLTKFE